MESGPPEIANKTAWLGTSSFLDTISRSVSATKLFAFCSFGFTAQIIYRHKVGPEQGSTGASKVLQQME